MYFDFDDRYTDIEPVGRAINRRDGVAVSVVVHVGDLLAFLFLPQFLPDRPLARPIVPPPEQRPSRREFVFVQPKVDLPALRPPDRADLSDADRKARTVERTPDADQSAAVRAGRLARARRVEPR